MARLEALSLREQDLPPGTCAVLASARRLRFLDVDHSRFDPAELRFLSAFSSLEYLSLNDTSIGDQHVPILAALMVTRLSLSRTRLTANGLTQLIRDKPAFLALARYRPVSWHAWETPPFYEVNPVELLEPPVTSPRYEPIDSLRRAERMDRRAELVEFLRNRPWEGSYRRGATAATLQPGMAIPRDFISLEIALRPGAIRTDRELATLGGFTPGDGARTWRLDMSNSEVTGRGFRDWRQGHVELLDVSGSKFDDVGMRYLGRATWLVRVRLNRTTITPAGLQWLPAGGRLVELSMNGVAIDDAAIMQLIDSGRLDNVLELGLEETQITERSLVALAQLRRLERLAIRGTRVTAMGIRDFRRAKPACENMTDVRSE